MKVRTPQQGLTLIELMMTLALSAIVLALGVPSYRALIDNAQRSSVITELGAALMYGRAEAVKRAATVSLCPSTSGTACAGGAAPEWNAGWVIFLDANRNLTVDGGETVLRVHAFQSPQFSLKGSGGLQQGTTFRPSGSADNAGQFDYRCPDGSLAHQVLLNPAGRLRVEKLKDSCAT